ncbi:uncharacterized protein LOC143029934 [Oratosquilla oratoria]|uniref:uncharacterized protein LOC143029934 n=1 Tax=Oratosquilla oratoria TaxID=337810 RepID=UPI003F764ED4
MKNPKILCSTEGHVPSRPCSGFSQPKSKWEKSLRVENDLPPVLVMGSCDEAVEVTQIAFCSILLARGSFDVRLRAALNSTEEAPTELESLVFPMVSWSSEDAESVLGHTTPSSPPGMDDAIPSPLQNCGSVAVLAGTRLKDNSTLYAVEMLLAGPGAVAIYVRSPKCQEGMALCADGRICSQECLLSCTDKGFFNSLAQKCTGDGETMYTSSLPTFTLRHLLTLLVESEEPVWKKETLKEPMVLEEGDELAIGCAAQSDLGVGKALARLYTRNASYYNSKGDQTFLVGNDGSLGSEGEPFKVNHLFRAFFTQSWSSYGFMALCEKLSTPLDLRTTRFNITETEVEQLIYRHTTIFTFEVLVNGEIISTLPRLVTRCQVAIEIYPEEFILRFAEEVSFNKSITKGTPVALMFNKTGTIIHGFIVDSGQNFKYEVTMPTESPGHFPLTGKIYNLVSEQRLNDTLHVIPPLLQEEWAFTCDSPKALPPGEISCNFSAMEQILYPPWKLNLTISLEGAQVHKEEWDLKTEPLIPEKKPSQPSKLIKCILTKAEVGDHIIVLKASNEVSEAEWMLQVVLKEAVDNIQCPSTFQPVEEDDLVDMLIKPEAGNDRLPVLQWTFKAKY